jgi:hypothetical protein
MRVLKNSVKLCQEILTNEALVKDPVVEVQQIMDELTKEFNVIVLQISNEPSK